MSTVQHATTGMCRYLWPGGGFHCRHALVRFSRRVFRYLWPRGVVFTAAMPRLDFTAGVQSSLARGWFSLPPCPVKIFPPGVQESLARGWFSLPPCPGKIFPRVVRYLMPRGWFSQLPCPGKIFQGVVFMLPCPGKIFSRVKRRGKFAAFPMIP